MIKLLHGENTVESRKVLVGSSEQAKKDGLDVLVFPGNKLTLADLRNALESGSLLGQNRLVIIENLHGGQKSKEKEKILDYISKEQFDNDLIIWEDKEIKKPAANFKATIFKVNQTIFTFLDSLKPGNQKEMLQLLKQVEQKEDAEMVFHMIIRQFRYLLLVKSGDLSLPDWQKQRFVKQASFFSEERLKKIYQQLVEIDYWQKTSKDPYNLYSRLDLFIADL